MVRPGGVIFGKDARAQYYGISPSDIAFFVLFQGADFLLKSALERIGFGVQQKEKCFTPGSPVLSGAFTNSLRVV
jgi:hypothetical protein